MFSWNALSPLGSVVEHSLHTRGVTSSNLVAGTTYFTQSSPALFDFSSVVRFLLRAGLATPPVRLNVFVSFSFPPLPPLPQPQPPRLKTDRTGSNERTGSTNNPAGPPMAAAPPPPWARWWPALHPPGGGKSNPFVGTQLFTN